MNSLLSIVATCSMFFILSQGLSAGELKTDADTIELFRVAAFGSEQTLKKLQQKTKTHDLRLSPEQRMHFYVKHNLLLPETLGEQAYIVAKDRTSSSERKKKGDGLDELRKINSRNLAPDSIHRST